jgi:ribonucleoside-diphosphate reductase beta chain
MYKECRANEWTPDEIGMGRDVQDFRSDLDPKHRHLFLSVMAQLTTFDIERGDDAAETFLRVLQPAELKQFLKRLIFEEAGHTQAYRFCIENMGIPEYGPDNIYDTWKQVDAMRKRVEMAQGISDELMRLHAADPDSLQFRRAFFRAAVFWFLIFEGVWFWLDLLGPVQQLSRLGLFKNTAEQFIYILRDESQHVKFGVALIRELMVQYPEVADETTLDIIRADTIRAIDLEGQFISYCLKDGPILGYSVLEHVETAKFFANMRMRSVGLPEPYVSPRHCFPWMSEQMELKKERNFFETRVTEYKTGGTLSFDDVSDNPFESVM